MSRPVLYPLRPIDSAVVRYTDAPHHRRRVTIDHQPLSGLMPAMLLDWFTHLGGTIRYGGEIIDRYLAWHPIDHIKWELARPAATGGAAEGARFRMVEAFGGRPEYTIDEIARVEKLDETGIRLVKRVAGVPGVSTRAHMVGRCAWRPLRDCHGSRSAVCPARPGQPDCAPTLS